MNNHAKHGGHILGVSNYKEFVAALAAGGTVAIDPGAIITITASTRIPRGGTRITSVDPARPGMLKLESGADWNGPLLYAEGVNGLTFDNFIIDGNFGAQGGKSRGKGYFNLCNLRNCDNTIIHHMQMRNGGCDGFQFRGCSGIKAYKNKVEYLGHDVFYLIGSNSNAEIYENDVLTFTNSAVRLSYGCTNVWIHNNYFHSVFTGGSTGPAIEIDKHGFSGILIEDNIIEDINGAAVWMTGDALNKGSIVIRNCVFKNTGVYKNYTGYSNAAIVNGNMHDVVVENCTFIDGKVGYSTFDRNGLSLSFNTTFKDCIFIGADIAAFRMTDAGGSATVINCNFYGNAALMIGSYTTLAKFSNSRTINPLLTSDYEVSKSSALYGTGIGYNAVAGAAPVENEEEEPEPDVPTTNMINCDTRLREASPTVVYTTSPYLDVGRSTATTRSLIYFNLDNLTAPVYKAELQLCWYYPAGKTRTNDTIVEVYRPGPWTDSSATWSKNASLYYDIDGKLGGTKPFASKTFESDAVPDNKYHSFDVTELVNAYIAGSHANTGFLIKSALELNDYIAFYGMYSTSSFKPQLYITAEPATVSVKVPIIDSRRYREANPTTVFDSNIYYDVGKSAGAVREQLTFDVTKFKEPVESAHLMLAWYYPAGKSRLADTVVTAYRPLTPLPAAGTWSTHATSYDATKAYGSVTIKSSVLPDGKFEAIDVTELVNAYITGAQPNTGIFIKSLAEANNYIAFHGDCAIENSVKPYILVKTKEVL